MLQLGQPQNTNAVSAPWDVARRCLASLKVRDSPKPSVHVSSKLHLFPQILDDFWFTKHYLLIFGFLEHIARKAELSLYQSGNSTATGTIYCSRPNAMTLQVSPLNFIKDSLALKKVSVGLSAVMAHNQNILPNFTCTGTSWRQVKLLCESHFEVFLFVKCHIAFLFQKYKQSFLRQHLTSIIFFFKWKFTFTDFESQSKWDPQLQTPTSELLSPDSPQK